MNEKNEEIQNNQDEHEPGFRFNFPFGLGWIRGDGGHVAMLMPAIRWTLIVASALYLILQIIREWKAT